MLLIYKIKQKRGDDTKKLFLLPSGTETSLAPALPKLDVMAPIESIFNIF